MNDRHYLILQLCAPIAAFGGATVDNYGVTRRFPARSMLTGLLANALGWQRFEADKLATLQRRIRYAVRLEHPTDGRNWRDFQTAQIENSDKHWTTHGEPSKRAGGAYGGPHLRYRDYLHDLRAHVALTLDASNDEPTLQTCEHALQRPARPLFIGRKPCLPSGPLWRETITAPHALAALRKVPLSEADDVGEQIPCFWMPGEGADLPAQRDYAICDERDWANSQHVGSRQVFEANIEVQWFTQGSCS